MTVALAKYLGWIPTRIEPTSPTGEPARGGRPLIPGTGVSRRAGRGALRLQQNADAATTAASEIIGDHTVDRGEQRVIAAATDVAPGMDARAALAHQDRPRAHLLAAETLDSQALRLAIPSVAAR